MATAGTLELKEFFLIRTDGYYDPNYEQLQPGSTGLYLVRAAFTRILCIGSLTACFKSTRACSRLQKSSESLLAQIHLIVFESHIFQPPRYESLSTSNIRSCSVILSLRVVENHRGKFAECT